MADENPCKKVRSGETTLTSSTTSETDIGEADDALPGVSSQNSAKNCNARDNALSNYLVLKAIISKLDNKDMESCCQVNEFWRSVAAPLQPRYYDIRLQLTRIREDPQGFFPGVEPRDDSLFSTTVSLRKRASYNSDLVPVSIYTLEEASRLLETALESEKIGIYLDIWNQNNCRIQHGVSDFLSKFGRFVETLSSGKYFSLRSFCELVACYFPNLRHLDLSRTSQTARDWHIDGNLFEKPMRHLRRLDACSDSEISDKSALVNIIRKAPNLEEIYDLPVLLVDAVVETEKAGCVKSLAYSTLIYSSFNDALEKLSHLGLRLQSFSFLSLCNSVRAPFIQRIFESSCDSLVSLTMEDSGPFDFNAIPSMTSLSEITFMIMFRENGFFSPDVDLVKVFPNVSTVEIPTLMNKYDVRAEHIVRCFPENQFLPWGLNIKTLKIVDASVEILEQLSIRFPIIKTLEFHVGKTLSELKGILTAIGKYWPHIECLTIVVYSPPTYVGHVVQAYAPCSLDSIFTGISDEFLAQLSDPSTRGNDFSLEKVESFNEASTLKKLKKLKTLTFDLDGPSEAQNFKEKMLAVTPVSHEFGFQFLPKLKIVVKTNQDNTYGMISEMKASLPPFMNLAVQRQQPLCASKWRRYYRLRGEVDPY